MISLCPIARRRRKDARPGELLSAGLEVFAERGFAATRLEEVAKRAGVSKGTVYLYFESKEALFKAAVESAVAPALQMANAIATDSKLTAAEALRAFISNWWQNVGLSPVGALPKLLIAESHNFPELTRWFLDNVMQKALGMAANIISSGIERGEFRAVDPLNAARIVFAPMFSYLVWKRAFGDIITDLPDPDAHFALSSELALRGLLLEDN